MPGAAHSRAVLKRPLRSSRCIVHRILRGILHVALEPLRIALELLRSAFGLKLVRTDRAADALLLLADRLVCDTRRFVCRAAHVSTPVVQGSWSTNNRPRPLFRLQRLLRIVPHRNKTRRFDW